MKRLLGLAVLTAAVASMPVHANHINWGTAGQRLYAADGEIPLPGHRERNETTTGFVQLLWLGPNGGYDGLAATGDGTKGDDQVIAQSWVGDGNPVFLPDTPGQFDASYNPPSAPYTSGGDSFAIRVFDTAVSNAEWAAGSIPANGNYNYVVFANPVKAADFYNLWIDDKLTVDIPLSWTLSVLAAEGAGATHPAAGEHPYDLGEDAQASANPAEGWELGHWLLNGENAGDANPIAVPAAGFGEIKTLQAVFVRKQYTISFDSAGGSAVDAITQDYGTAVTPPADPTLAGHTFAGWNPMVPETMPATNPTLVAQWTVNQYTISFDSTGGTPVEPITQDYGTAVTPPADPTLAGHTFAGWNLVVPATMPATNPTLVAQWTVNQYTITFDSAGGSAVDAITQDYGTAVTAPADPTLAGHTFAGWEPTIPATMPADNPTLIAQWTVNQYTLIYTASANGSIDGEPEVVQTIVHGEDGQEVTAVPDDGYRFKQWNDDRTDNPRTDNHVTTLIVVTAEFEPKWVPTITWPAPAAVVYGTALSDTQLNAEADTDGAFAYDPPAGTVLPAGPHTLRATFTPADEENWAATAATVALTVEKAPQAIDFPNPGPQTYTDTVALAATGGGSGNPATFAVAEGPAAIDGGVLRFTGVGEVTVTASQAGDDNHEPAPDVSRTFTVSKATATVALAELEHVYDGTARSAAASTDPEGLAVAFTYAGEPDAPVAAGTYAVVATVVDDNFAGQAEGELTVARRPAEVAADDQAKTFGEADPPLTYTVVVAPVAADEFAGELIREPGEDAGTYAIAAGTLTLGPNYDLAVVPGTLTIGKATPTITWPAPTAIVYGTALDGTQLNAEADTAGAFVYDPPAGTILPVGAHTLRATFTPADGENWAATGATVELTVEQAPLAVTAADRGKIYGEAVVFAGDEFTVDGLVGEDTVTTVALASAGAAACAPVDDAPYAIVPSDATGAGLDNYAIEYVNGALAVARAALTVTANNATRRVGQTNPAFSCTPTGLVCADTLESIGLAVAYDCPADEASDPGDYPITPAGPATTDNYDVAYVAGTLTVTAKQVPTITWPAPAAVVYGTALSDTQLNAEADTAGAFVYDPPAGTILPVGAHTLRATFTPADGENWAATGATVELTVEQAPLTVTAADRGKTYGQAVVFAGTEFTVEGLVGEDAVTTVTLASDGAAACAPVAKTPYAIVPSAAVGAGLDNYVIEYVNGALAVAQATLTVTADNATRRVGQPNPAFSCTPTGLVCADTLASISIAVVYDCPADEASAPADYPITPSGPATTDNYAATYVAGTLTVTAKQVPTITWAAPAAVVYGVALDEAHLNAEADTDGAFVYDPPAGTILPVGAHNLRATFTPADELSWAATEATVALTVEKAILTVTANDGTRRYGDENPPFSVSYKDFVDGEDADDLGTPPTAVCEATPASPVGDYAVAPTGGVDENYAFAYVEGTLSVNPAPLVCTADDKIKAYGSANPALTISYTGLKNSETAPATPPAVACAADVASPVGPYPITLTGGSDPNYTLTLADGMLTVSEKLLTVTADDKTRLYGDPNPALTIVVDGYVLGEDASVLDVVPAAVCVADATSPAGDYAIVPDGGVAGNYAFAYVDGTLSVLAGGRFKLWADAGDGASTALELGETEIFEDGIGTLDVPAVPGAVARLMKGLGAAPAMQAMARDFRPIPADELTRWRLEVSDVQTRGAVTLTWNVDAAAAGREVWLQELADERPVGLPVDMKARNELPDVAPGTAFEIVYGALQTHEIPLRRGWNAVGTPLLGLQTLGQLVVRRGDGEIGFPAWRWGASGFARVGADAPLLAETGYLILCLAESATLSVTGLPPDGVLPLGPGWHLLSPVEAMAPPVVRAEGSAAWRWDGDRQSHRAADAFEPGEAYWWHGGRGTAVGEPTAGELLKSTRGRDLEPDAGDLGALVAGNTAFAIDLYHQWRGADGNLFLSPHSISIALGMTYAGARGETATQMSTALRFGLPDERLHAAFNALDLELASRGEGAAGTDGQPFRLRVVNQLWGERTYTFLPPFLDTLAEHYGAGLRAMDFIGAAEPARLAINVWVAYQTEQRIQDLLPQGSVNNLTRLVLTNAVYFNAAWQSPFPTANSGPGSFVTLAGGAVQVPMMRQTANFPAQVGASWTAVELPYDGGELSMLLLVPDAGAFADFERELTAARLAAILAGLSTYQVTLALPSFEYSCKASLKSMLAQLGMPVAFAEGADFSGMDGTRDLLISDVFHQAFVKVNEAGTEAAAATGVVVGVTSVPEPLALIIDRPFIFLIRDRATGAILFLGRVLDPR